MPLLQNYCISRATFAGAGAGAAARAMHFAAMWRAAESRLVYITFRFRHLADSRKRVPISAGGVLEATQPR